MIINQCLEMILKIFYNVYASELRLRLILKILINLRDMVIMIIKSCICTPSQYQYGH